ncbi:MAG: response regulator [Candidatus Omnitrophica bacterium]|nr:response regulator [Candidatus Omnitrophota bacterium]
MAKKVLVVDDEPDVLKVVSFRLKKAGYEVLTAVNGKIAIDLILEDKPDLIILDLRMPVMDGYEVCTKIKADETLKKIPVILLTASSGGSNITEKMVELKADDCMIKPFNADELLKKVQKFIG